MIGRLLQAGMGAGAMIALSASQASAACLLFLCDGDPGAGDAPHAPEIDVGQGFAALGILICIVIVLREKFLRSRA